MCVSARICSGMRKTTNWDMSILRPKQDFVNAFANTDLWPYFAILKQYRMDLLENNKRPKRP